MERRCDAIRAEAEEVINAFRAHASQIASGARTGVFAIPATTLPGTPVAPSGEAPVAPVVVPEPPVPDFVRSMHYEVTDSGAAASNMDPRT